MEENVVYDKLVQNVGTTRLGKLQDAAFATGAGAATQNPGTAASATNLFIFATKISGLVCPSFPGEEEVNVGTGNSFTAPTGGNSKMASGNYVALAATHYTGTTNHLESGLPTTAGAATGKNCASGAYCGNGGLPFPGVVGGKVQKTGLGFQSLSDGTSKVALIAESREEAVTSWYSGLASYVVGHWPNVATSAYPVGSPAVGTNPQLYWVCPAAQASCDHALNKGDTKSVETKYYLGSAHRDPHANLNPANRIWGPSSRHPGVVIHGYADSHTEGVTETIDRDVYFHIITRNGREVDNP
jgi:hypothetical protein